MYETRPGLVSHLYSWGCPRTLCPHERPPLLAASTPGSAVYLCACSLLRAASPSRSSSCSLCCWNQYHLCDGHKNHFVNCYHLKRDNLNTWMEKKVLEIIDCIEFRGWRFEIKKKANYYLIWDTLDGLFPSLLALTLEE